MVSATPASKTKSRLCQLTVGYVVQWAMACACSCSSRRDGRGASYPPPYLLCLPGDRTISELSKPPPLCLFVFCSMHFPPRGSLLIISLSSTTTLLPLSLTSRWLSSEIRFPHFPRTCFGVDERQACRWTGPSSFQVGSNTISTGEERSIGKEQRHFSPMSY